MEPKFQTSFIPKKPMVASSGTQARHSISIFLTISIIIFIISLGGAGFAFAWENVLKNQQDQYKKDLAADQNQFNTSLISTLTTANRKINIAENLLENHLDVSEIFKIIGQLTISSVQWNSFNFSAPATSGASASGAPGDVTISMQGVTDSYYSVAYQSDVFGASSQFGTNKAIKNPVLSNLSAGQDGKVSFSFTASVDPSELSYQEKIIGNTATSTNSVLPSNQ